MKTASNQKPAEDKLKDAKLKIKMLTAELKAIKKRLQACNQLMDERIAVKVIFTPQAKVPSRPLLHTRFEKPEHLEAS